MTKKLSIRFLKNLPAHEKRLTLSTLITIARIVLTPFIVIAMVHHQWGLAFWLFVIASLCDVLDGNLARLLNQQTFLGACLDPLADKILLISCFFTLTFIDTPLFMIPRWFFIAILIKEMTIIAGSLLIYTQRGHLEVHPTWLGKGTTVAQTVFITWLFSCYFFHWMPVKTYYVMLGVLLLLSIGNLMQYIMIGLNQWRKR